MDSLTPPEQLILLCFGDSVPREGPKYLELAVVGAQIAALEALHRLGPVGPKQSIGALDGGPTGDDLLDALLQDMTERTRIGKSVRLTDTHPLPAYLQRLVDRGLLEAAEERVLRVFTMRLYRTRDTAPLTAIRSDLDAFAVHGVMPPGPGSLGTLMWAIASEYTLYPGRQGRPCRKRIRQLGRKDWIAQWVRKSMMAVAREQR